jgi:hypothetical protein
LDFGVATKVAEFKKLALGMRRGPRIAVANSNLVVAAIGNLADSEGDLLAWRSSYRGKTWKGPSRVNDSPRAAREGLHAIAAAPSGGFYCVWLDLRGEGNKIYGARSNDGGETWSANILVYQSPGGTVCECCHPSVAIDSDGRIYVMWRNWLDGNRDMYLTSSDDGGKTFDPASKLGSTHWSLHACPMDGGAIGLMGNHQLIAAWRSSGYICLSRGGVLQESKVAEGAQPWIAASAQGGCIVWLAAKRGPLYGQRLSESNRIKLSDAAAFPVVATVPGTRPKNVAAWEQGNGTLTSIKVRTIPDQ